MNKINWKKHILGSLKIAAAALLAILVAGELGLKNSATAGIITILSIRATKRETLQSFINRGVAYLCALVLAYFSFQILGYTWTAFAVYLFFFALVCMNAGWQEAISSDSVLITHFLSAGNMGRDMLVNETLLFVIGAGVGVMINLHLHKKEADFERLAGDVDEQIKGILRRMARWLRVSDKSEYGSDCFDKVEETIRQAKLCAASNFNNSLWEKDTYELDYIRMRQQQTVVLKGIYRNIKMIDCSLSQAEKVADLFVEVEQAYHRENTVEGLLEKLQDFLEEMKREELPGDRAEFEARAILFYILTQMEELLQIKRKFIMDR